MGKFEGSILAKLILPIQYQLLLVKTVLANPLY